MSEKNAGKMLCEFGRFLRLMGKWAKHSGGNSY